MAALHGIAADEAQLRHQHGREPFDLQRLLLAAQQLGLNARAVRQDPRRLARAPLPAVARDAAGRFFVVARIEGAAAMPAGTGSCDTIPFIAAPCAAGGPAAC